MRTLTTAVFLSLVIATAACTNDDGNCTQTSGCIDKDGGVDTADPCGDGVCNAGGGESATTCSEDCSGQCNADPDLPVFCQDAHGNPTCNPVHTDCGLPVMEGCGAGPKRCPDYEVVGRCCDTADGWTDVVWCPDEASCQTTPERQCYGEVFHCSE